MPGDIHILLEQLDIGFKTRPADRVLIRNMQSGIRKGEMICIIGKNGTGKTTLIRTFCRLLPSLSGEIFINNANIRQYSNHQLSRIIGYVSTSRVVLANLNIFELVSLGRIPYTNWLGTLDRIDIEKINQSVEMTGLDNLIDRKISEISDGERQRAMIARTLAQDTEIILLDEPTAFLDMMHRYEIIHLLHTLTRHPFNRTVIFTTHDINIALQYADRFWILKDESVIEGSPEDLVLNGEIRSLVSDSEVDFSADTGQFAVKRTGLRDISLCGPDYLEKRWTTKALERLGFNVRRDCNELPKISVDKVKGKMTWTLKSYDKHNQFFNIYDLASSLRE